jgi:alkylation response protein AidB-like acyl-CoA dehydrogenase
MDFGFTPEQEELRKLAQKAFAGKDVMAEAQRAGLFDVASEYGFVELCIVLEQLGRAGRPQPLEAAFLGALAMAQLGTPELKRRHQDGFFVLCDGELQVERGNNGYLVDGILQGVPLVDEATRLLVQAGDKWLLVDPRSATCLSQLPTDESALQQLTFARAEVPEGDILRGNLSQQRAVALCAVELGLAQAQLQMTAEHVMRRQQFGKPIGLFQAVAQRCGDMWVDVESLRLVTWHAAWLIGQGRDATRETHAAAFFAAEAGQRIANAAQHLHAGIGFDRAYPLYRYFLAAKQLELLLGGANRRLAELGAIFAEVDS